jgi:hypothetical protein
MKNHKRPGDQMERGGGVNCTTVGRYAFQTLCKLPEVVDNVFRWSPKESNFYYRILEYVIGHFFIWISFTN